MVHKTSYRGVHSGNTLRAFNSRFSRRYHNQACILSRVHPSLLKKLVGEKSAIGVKEAADDKTIEKLNGNVAVNVALSLNKQSRWLLPSALIRQIDSDDIAHGDLTVSLLERHKLKRPANCISFHSNKIKGTRHGGRYFGFSYLTADGKSRRALRRERREILRKQNIDARSNTGKIVNVYTETGSDTHIGESEVRYEVFYPSPVTSSISHNPKYIKQDVSDAPGHTDDHAQFGKPRKQHRGKQRKRMTLKDIDECDLPTSHGPDAHQEKLTSITTSGNHEVITAADETAAEEYGAVDFLLSSLIEKAERLQNIADATVRNAHRRKRSGSSSNKGLYHHHQDNKSHIIYLPENPLATEELSPQVSTQESSPQVAAFVQPAAPTECTRVLLPGEDVTMEALKECFGQDYFEAACSPRKFVLNVTSSVRELLKKCGVQSSVAGSTPDALSYLIFTHDGFYNEEFDVYKILLNSKLHQGLTPVKVTVDESQQDLYRGTVMNLISITMDFVKGFITKLQEENHFPCYLDSICSESKAPNRELKLTLGSAEVYFPSVQQVFQLGSAVTDISMPTMSDLLEEEPVFCDICYDDISPLTQDSAAATALLKCKHKVCDSCWAQHIHSRLTQGFVRVTCPGYDCQEEVKVGVLLSLATLDTVEKVLQRQEEVRVGASATEKWCPGWNCGRVIRLQDCSGAAQGHLQQDVMCACGAHVCFHCLSAAHWPATCTQAKDYRANLVTLIKDSQEKHESTPHNKQQEEMENKLMVVEGKHCPSCKNFVCKFGGGPQMTCRCGQMFCWYCARPGYAHPNRQNCVSEADEKKLTTTVFVHHLDGKGGSGKDQQQKSASRRHRVSLLEKAVEHRHHRLSGSRHNKAIVKLAKAVSTAAAKDKSVAQHIISICSPYFTPSHSLPSSSPDSTMSTTPGVLDVVTSFLKRSALCKQELFEVTEYTLVLLKDIPDCLFRKRALRITEDLNAFCLFAESIFDTWGGNAGCFSLQEGVKAVTRLVEIQGWIRSAVANHVTTIRKLRSNAAVSSDKQ